MTLYLKTIAFICLLVFNNVLKAQVKKFSIVEHFTNTSCSICASNNPSIHQTIFNRKDVLHVSFHPSSPYANDVFNVLNKQENDNRTKFYGVFGSTPRLILNGKSVATNNLSTSISKQDTISNFKISITQVLSGNQMYSCKVTIKKMGNDTLEKALLFVGAIEDTIYQSTNNGEKIHFNVFRKSFSNIQGDTISLPKAIGDSLVLSYQLSASNDWNKQRIFTIGVLQELNRAVINSARSVNTNQVSILNTINSTNQLNLYPNPNQGGILFSNTKLEDVLVYQFTGKLLYQLDTLLPNQPLFLNNLPSGVYLIKAKLNGVVCQQIIKLEN